MPKWKKTKVAGYAVTHAPGPSPASIRTALSKLASEKRLSKSDRCPIIIFRKPLRAVQRCEGKTLPAKTAGGRAAARRRLQARFRRGEICRTAKGKFTTRCPGRRR